jgi:hypothetical protein
VLSGECFSFAEGNFQFLSINACYNGWACKAALALGILRIHQVTVAGMLIPQLAPGGDFKPFLYTLMGFQF